MSVRQFTVPMVALALTTTLSACGPDALVGTWLLTAIELDGEDYSSYLDGYSETYDGCTYSARTEFTLEVDADDQDGEKFDGEFVQTYFYSYVGDCEEESYSDSYSYDAEAEQVERGTYEIEVDELEWELECTLEDDTLDCEGEADDERVEAVFERD